jgi:hypothetical protein
MAVRSSVGLGCSNTGIVGLSPSRGMYVYLYPRFFLLCCPV